MRDASGKFVASDGTRAAARKGGLARARSLQLAQLLGLDKLDDSHPHAPYARLAQEWRDDYLAELSARVGGGHVGAGVAAIVSSAALQLAASRYLSDLAARREDAKLFLDAQRLADANRQNILAAHELAAKEAERRPKQSRTEAALARIRAGGSST